MNNSFAAIGAILLNTAPHVLGHYAVERLDRWRAARRPGRHRKPCT